MRVTKIRDLNPAPGGVDGADLAIPVFIPSTGETWFFWGDTFKTPLGRPEGPPMLGLSNHRSPVVTVAPADSTVMTHALHEGRQLRDYPHDGSLPEGVTTFLPTDAIEIDGVVYLWVMGSRLLADRKHPELGEKWCEIWTYNLRNPNGWEWDGKHWDVNVFNEQRRHVSWTLKGDYVYAISTTGLNRDRNLLAWRIPKNQLLNEDAWLGWAWVDEKWGWHKNKASDIFPAGFTAGEITIDYLQGHFVIAGFDSSTYSAIVKVGYGQWEEINWHTTTTHRPIVGAGIPAPDRAVQPRLYGCYPHPDSKLDGRFMLIVSVWTEGGGEYKAIQYDITDINWLLGEPPVSGSTSPVESPAPQPDPAPGPLKTTNLKMSVGDRLEITA